MKILKVVLSTAQKRGIFFTFNLPKLKISYPYSKPVPLDPIINWRVDMNASWILKIETIKERQ